MLDETTSKVKPNTSFIEPYGEHPFKIETIQEEAPFVNVEAPKDNQSIPSTSDSKTEAEMKPKVSHVPKQDQLPRRARTRKRPKKACSYKASTSCPPPHLPPLLRTPKRNFTRLCGRNWSLLNSRANFSPPKENDADMIKSLMYVPPHNRTKFKTCVQHGVKLECLRGGAIL